MHLLTDRLEMQISVVQLKFFTATHQHLEKVERLQEDQEN